MLVNPSTKIYLCSNIKTDREYNNVVYWNSATEQINYFAGKAEKSFTEYSYQRQNNSIKVGCSSDSVLSCNYIVYQNSAFTNKWFYCFIDNIVYISDETCEVFFTIDIFNTWFFEINVRQCFVEREHVSLNLDTYNQNLVDEGLDVGEHTTNNLTPYFYDFESLSLVIATGSDKDGAFVGGGVYGRIFSGILYKVFSLNSQSDLDQIIQFLKDMTDAGKNDSIISMYMIPTKFVVNGNNIFKETISFTMPTNFLDYTPKNKKLLQYPYNFLNVTNLSGNTGTFKYEYFKTSNVQFSVSGTYSTNPEAEITPRAYKTSAVIDNPNESILLSGFPQCAYTIDTYRAWLAQNAGGIINNLVNSAADIIPTNGEFDPTSPLKSVGSTVANLRDSYYKNPPQIQGQNAPLIRFANHELTFGVYQMQITPERAKIIDNYFELYGYKVNTLKIPNMNNRPHWNYVKTAYANIYCSTSINVVNQIKDVFNKGVTFWKNADEIGNYSLNNH